MKYHSVVGRQAVLAICAPLFLALACSGGESSGPHGPASVTVSPSSGTVVTGLTLQLSATVLDSKQSTLTTPVTWSSSNAAVATVSASGLVSGVTPGSTSIAASAGGKSGAAQLTVILPPVASITISPPTASVDAGSTTTLIATTKDAAGSVLTGRLLSWSSSNPAIATVSQTGMVTGVASGGPVTMTATAEGITGSSSVTVLPVIISAFGRVSLQRAEVDTREPSGCTGGPFCYGPRNSGDVFVRVWLTALDRPAGPTSAELFALFRSVALSGNGMSAQTASVIVQFGNSPRFYLVFVPPLTATTSRMGLLWPGNNPLEFLPGPVTASTVAGRVTLGRTEGMGLHVAPDYRLITPVRQPQ